MATRQSARGEPGSANGSVTIQCFHGIRRTGWREATVRRKKWREHELVGAYRTHQRATRKLTELHESPNGARRVAPTEEVGTQRIVGCPVGLAASTHEEIAGRLHRLHFPAPDFLQSAPETIAGHRGRLESGNDQPHARMAQCIVGPDQVDKRGPAAPTLCQAPPDVGCSRQPARPLEALFGRQARPCFDGRETVRRLRPFLRRRDRTSRPQRSAIRARKPCLAMRFLLRGRYVGIIRFTCPPMSPRK
jgi:hypothetical protein